MLLPHELKEKTFSRVMRGYNPAEVEDYLNFIIEKYSELYRENDDLARKLNAAVAKIEELGSGDAAVRATLINAKKAADRIVEEANGRADMILNSIKSRSDAILAEYRVKIEAEQQALAAVENRIAKFKAVLYEEYSAHIDAIEKLTVSADSLPEDFDYVGTVIAGVKEDLTNAVAAETAETTEEVPVQEEMAAEEYTEYTEAYAEDEYAVDEVSSDEVSSDEVSHDEYTSDEYPEEAYADEVYDDGYAEEEYAEEYADEYTDEYAEEYADEMIPEEDANTGKKMGFLARHGYTLRKEKKAEEASPEDEFDLLYSDDQGE